MIAQSHAWQNYMLTAIACHQQAARCAAAGIASHARIERDIASRAIERAVATARHHVMRQREQSIGDLGSMGFAIACEQRLMLAFRCAMLDGNLAIAEQAVRECAA